MSVKKPNTPQTQFFDDADILTPDINQLYSNYITEIDSYRSRFNAINSILSESISSDKIDLLFANSNTITNDFQESRISAFYRTIGFPVVDKNFQFYNPGFNPEINKNQILFNSQIKIANSYDPALRKLTDQRELYVNNSSNIFSNQDQTSIAYAMASFYVRSFDNQFKDGISALAVDKQVQQVAPRANILQFFSDLNLNITQSAISSSTHILKPFIVDARVELTVIPSKNRICAPFASDKSQTELVSGSSSVQLKRPYIEKVISTRFNTQNVSANNGKSSYIQNILNFIEEDNSVIDQNLLTALSTDLNSINSNDVITFSKYIQISRSLINTLVDSILTINKVRTEINWQPIPNVKGPEYGNTLKDVDLNDRVRNKEIEQNINLLTTKKTIDELNFGIGLSAPDTSNFAFSGIDDIIFGSFKNVSKFYDDQINDLASIRNQYGNRANTALKNIEIIMGEFSGIGLLDILAIQSALWIIDQPYLIGFLDSNAFARMQKNKQLQYNGSIFGIEASLNEYEKKMKDIYRLYQSFIDSRLGIIKLNS